MDRHGAAEQGVVALADVRHDELTGGRRGDVIGLAEPEDVGAAVQARALGDLGVERSHWGTPAPRRIGATSARRWTTWVAPSARSCSSLRAPVRPMTYARPALCPHRISNSVSPTNAASSG